MIERECRENTKEKDIHNRIINASVETTAYCYLMSSFIYLDRLPREELMKWPFLSSINQSINHYLGMAMPSARGSEPAHMTPVVG